MTAGGITTNYVYRALGQMVKKKDDVDGYPLKIGGYSAIFKFYPSNGAALLGPTHDYNYVAEDFQVRYIGENHIVTVKATHVQENI